MGAIKIEFDLPEFKEELNINIVIRKDGEVVKVETTNTSSFPALPSDNVGVSTGDKKTSTTVKRKKEPKAEPAVKLGNMMSFDF